MEFYFLPCCSGNLILGKENRKIISSKLQSSNISTLLETEAIPGCNKYLYRKAGTFNPTVLPWSTV